LKKAKKIDQKKFTKSQLVLIVGVFLIAAVSFAGFYQLGQKSDRVSTADSCSDSKCIDITKDGMKPGEVAVKAGSFVQFNARDGKTHNLSLGKGGEAHDHSGPFHSGDFKKDEAWRVQFKQEGSYYFHDHYDPSLSVLVVVYKAGKEYKIN
jgi:plastocyanin